MKLLAFVFLFIVTAAHATDYAVTTNGGGIYSGAGTGKSLAAADSEAACDEAIKADAAAKKITKPTTYTCKLTKTVGVAPPPPGPLIDKSLIPAPAPGISAQQVRSVWRQTVSPWAWGCTPGSANCARPAAYAFVPNQSIGAFRTVCAFAKMAFDDPIVFPGLPGASHLHTFFGNAGIDAFSTTASIAGSGNSTCSGGTLNLSSYWVPAMIDTGIGKPLVPYSMVTYYKGSYEFDISGVVVPPPAGLRMVSGNARNTDPAKTGARYICYGPAGENPGWKSTITAAFADGTCKVGGDFVMAVPFPQCWDGVNLDSPNHASHMSYVVQDQTSPYAKHCPATHPVVLPVISYNIHYTITDDAAVSRWRLSSDMDATLPAGITGHGDYFFGWAEETAQAWTKNCIRGKLDCHADLLGDDRTLY